MFYNGGYSAGMNKLIIVVANRGALKILHAMKDPHRDIPHLEPLEELSLQEARSRWADRVTDSPGQFCNNDGTGTRAAGERHNAMLEQDRRLFRTLAECINRNLIQQQPESWYLAAPSEMLHALLDYIDPQLKNQLHKTVGSDLTKVDREVLTSHFWTKQRPVAVQTS